jgi:septal ring factor EnvC (AmiA/AmiB activator)
MKKDKNGIEKKCSNCRYYEVCASNEVCEKYTITVKAYEARIAELQKELAVVQESERAEAQEADRLRGEVKELKADNEVLQKRVEEFSMELLDRTMEENKDVLERLKQAESEDNI